MHVRIGTSGYAYKEWKGSFYPSDLPADGMLGYYASRLDTVEINNTFYRMPSEKVLLGWAAQVPETFRFILKAPRRLTHIHRLSDEDDSLDYFLRTAGVLEGRLGATLFQLPPTLKKDTDRLAGFLGRLPRTWRTAFEFRHDSWMDEEVFTLLRERNAALCLADTDDAPAAVVSTADWGYLRLRRAGYTDPDLREWAARIAAQPWDTAYVFLKHEDTGAGPELAERLVGLTTGRS